MFLGLIRPLKRLPSNSFVSRRDNQMLKEKSDYNKQGVGDIGITRLLPLFDSHEELSESYRRLKSEIPFREIVEEFVQVDFFRQSVAETGSNGRTYRIPEEAF